MESRQDWTVPGRCVYVRGNGWIAKIEWTGHHWVAVELNEWGGFRRRLYDGREG